MIGAGIVTGNILGFFRVALTAYLLGTGSTADALAVAIGPLDTLNQIVTNTIIFAFVPLLTERSGPHRTALFLQMRSLFGRLFLVQAAALLLLAPWLLRLLAPGLDPATFDTAVTILRIGSLSTVALGVAAVHSALLYTDRRFAPSAFYQATLNVCTMAFALIGWQWLGVYGFAIGYLAGAGAQLLIVSVASRSRLSTQGLPQPALHWRQLVSQPGPILAYSAFIALNVTVTRAYATELGTGTAAAFEYCMRCIGVPLAFLVSPASNSLLPEIARLRKAGRLREAFRLIDRVTVLVAFVGLAGCALAIAVREPVIALIFERGSFTAESTRLVAAVFLGFAPALIGWSLLELTSRCLFSLERTWLPVVASTLPVLSNLAVIAAVRSPRPEWLGLGATIGFAIGFLTLFLLARASRTALLASMEAEELRVHPQAG